MFGNIVAVEVKKFDVEPLKPLHHREHGLAVVYPPGLTRILVMPRPLDIVDGIPDALCLECVPDHTHFIQKVPRLEDIDPESAGIIMRSPVVVIAIDRVLQRIDPNT